MKEKTGTETDISQIKTQIYEYQIEHRDLDKVIDYLEESSTPDELLIRRLKKRKLMLKDHVMHLEHSLQPDEPA